MNDRSLIAGAVRQTVLERYHAVRALSARLAEPLSSEDQCVQAMPDASPTKWHLAHTSWFFETVILSAFAPDYRVFDQRFHYLFNSYYESLGSRQARPQRGLISRPGVAEVRRYRAHVDAAMESFILACDERVWEKAQSLIALGLNHEQQHQELILTDIKYTLSLNAFEPAYLEHATPGTGAAAALTWSDFSGSRVEIGHNGSGFAFDNEGPRHEVLLRPYQLANRPVSCGEYLAFIADGGYERPEFWLSDGWAMVREQGWQAPLYWRCADDGSWSIYSLHGRRPLNHAEPVCHVSFYEAAAYATWAEARLPTEFEWEAAVADLPVVGNWIESGALHPHPSMPGTGLQQVFGDVWEWTRSSYDPYPGFKPLSGAVAEYNGKFMVSQVVLRGGSCASPAGHLRASYRNFFPPSARWQFSGIRLARDL